MKFTSAGIMAGSNDQSMSVVACSTEGREKWWQGRHELKAETEISLLKRNSISANQSMAKKINILKSLRGEA